MIQSDIVTSNDVSLEIWSVSALAWLEQLSDWIVGLDIGSGELSEAGGRTCSPCSTVEDRSHIFVNGNLARVLLATWRLQEGSADHTGNQTLLEAGLSWLDSLCDQQAEIQTSKGNAGGYWGAGYPVTGPRGSIYFGDTGTAVTALAVCHSLSNRNRTRQVQYSEALAKLANFVTDGCHQIPAKYDAHQRCPPKATGWIVGSTVLTHSHPIILDQQDLIKSL